MARKTNHPQKPVLDNAAVAKLVKRKIAVLDKAKKPTGETKLNAVAAEEVFAFKEYDDHVMVVTVDGQKLQGDTK